MVRLAPSRPTPSAQSPADGLPLPLQGALNSLNVQVEQELARYRQSRRGEIPSARSHWLKGRQPLKLIPVPPTPVAAPLAPAATTAPPLPTEPEAVTPGTFPVPAPEVSLAGATAIRASRPSLFQTPLGVGLLLLLGVSGIGLGIAAANPATISPLLARLAAYWPNWENGSDVVTSEEETLDGGTETAIAPPETRPQPLEPDLSRQEFTPLDLSSLSTLPSRLATRPIPSALPPGTEETAAADPTADPTANQTLDPSAIAPAPAETVAPASRPERLAATTPSSPAPAPRASTSAPSANGAPRATTPAPSSPPRPATPAPAASPAPARFFYVVTDYTGDASLDQARQVVGDAYVRNFPVGARIQVGAFSSQGEATAAAERLQRDGLSVEVYQP